jgi:hypothetical protein
VAEQDRRLIDVYGEVMLEEPLDLPRFMERVAAGAYGRFAPAEIAAFLREVEQDILGSISTKAGAAGIPPEVAEERAEETHRLIADLLRRYAPGA